MRYYDLTITPASGGQPVRHYTSHPNGLQQPPDPGALKVEFDLLIGPNHIPITEATGGGEDSKALVRVWGIPLGDIAQAQNLSTPTGAGPTYNVVFKGGMGKGLPLANPAQAGTLVQGQIWRAIGNWIGVDMTLDLYLQALPQTTVNFAGTNTPPQPAVNLTLNWKAGTPMATALTQTLRTAYPNAQLNVAISPQLILDRDVPGIYPDLQSFSQFVKEMSRSVLGSNPQSTYLGVDITSRDGQIYVDDHTQNPNWQKTTSITFFDLVGQPTWTANNTIQITTILRADISQGDKITIPATATTAQGGGGGLTQFAPGGQFASSRFNAQFQGDWLVRQVRHVGNYKAPDGQAWVSIFECINNQFGPALPAATPTNGTTPSNKPPNPLSTTSTDLANTSGSNSVDLATGQGEFTVPEHTLEQVPAPAITPTPFSLSNPPPAPANYPKIISP